MQKVHLAYGPGLNCPPVTSRVRKTCLVFISQNCVTLNYGEKSLPTLRVLPSAGCQLPIKLLHLPPSAGCRGKEKIRWKKPVAQDNSSLIKQKQRLYVEAEEKKILILYFPSAGVGQPILKKQGSSRHSSYHNTNIVITNAPCLLLSFYC